MDTLVEAPLNPASESAQDAPDANASPSSAATQDAKEESSTTSGAEKPKSLSEVLDAVTLEEPEETGAATEQAEDQTTEDSPSTEAGAETGEEVANGAPGAKDETPKANAASDGSLNVPFQQRPEWQAAIKLVPKDRHKDLVKAMRPVFEREAKLNHQLKAVQPLADVAREFREMAGDEKGFETMRTIIRAYATDPAASVPILEQMLDDARQRGGLVITSPDLKTRLAEIDQQTQDGLLDEAVAAKWKADLVGLEKTRAASKTAQQTKAAQQQQQTAAQRRALENDLNNWESNIRERDPDFGDVTDVSDPSHGKSVADQVFDGLCLYQTRQPNATGPQLLAEVERIYKLAKSRLIGGRALPTTRKALTSHTSSVTARPKPLTARQAMDLVKLE